MVNWVPIVAAAEAAVPAAAVFFAAYGRYDGAFKDNIVFVYFIGGLVLGGFLGFLSLFLLSGLQAIWIILGMSLLFPVAIVAAINRRKWQGQRHAVFNGGAAGLGASVMVGFSFLYYLLSKRMEPAAEAARAAGLDVDTALYAFDRTLAPQGLVLALGLAGLFFYLGLLAGDGVRRRHQIRVALLGSATMIPAALFLEEYMRGASRGDPVWIWPVLLLAYGAIVGVVAARKLLPLGVEDDARRQRRRKQRAQAE